MARPTIEIDMDDPQETWDALYRRIESIADASVDGEANRDDSPTPTTYDLLLEPEQTFGGSEDCVTFAAPRRD